jgi:phosphatidylserine/phosphatidylglycerophosphate/cardiolipin synthase-like enzyme
MFASDPEVSGAMTSEMQTARRRIDLILPTLTAEDARELARLAADKVKVRVITGPLGKCRSCTLLEKSGADVRYVTVPVLDHFAVIDGPTLRTSSGDPARLVVRLASQLGQGESLSGLMVFRREGDLALSYQDEFNFIWSKAREFGKSRFARVGAVRAPAAVPTLFTTSNLVPIELPSGWQFTAPVDAKARLIGSYVVGAIDHAYDTIDVLGYDPNDRDVTDALRRAHGRGVRIRALPASGSAMVVIDGKRAITGNFAFGAAAEFATLSHVVTVGGAAAEALAQAFAQTHKRRHLAAASAQRMPDGR